MSNPKEITIDGATYVLKDSEQEKKLVFKLLAGSDGTFREAALEPSEWLHVERIGSTNYYLAWNMNEDLPTLYYGVME